MFTMIEILISMIIGAVGGFFYEFIRSDKKIEMPFIQTIVKDGRTFLQPRLGVLAGMANGILWALIFVMLLPHDFGISSILGIFASAFAGGSAIEFILSSNYLKEFVEDFVKDS